MSFQDRLHRMRILRRNMGPARIYAPTRRWRPEGRPDVVLLQGFGTGPITMHPLARSLEEEHGLVCCVPRLGGMLGYLQTRGVGRAGKTLAEFLASLPPGSRPWLVGHSIGGVIAREAIQRSGASSSIAGLVTIGCPHRGTPAAIAGLVTGMGLLSFGPWQMVPGAPTLRRLNGLPWPEDLPLISIVSSGDLLCPPRCGSLPYEATSSLRELKVEGLGHTEMLRDPGVIARVAELVRQPSV
ncbi:MAG: hypothetical protein VX498_08760 [Myxococcota bacterium]|nr:hypothetical protein [Myxococcota bacterium]